MYNLIKRALNKSRTANFDLCYQSTLSKNVDFFGKASSVSDAEEVAKMFSEAYFEDADMGIKNLLYLRDIRSGNGMRSTFREALLELALIDADKAIKLLPLVPEIGRWDDVVYMLNSTKATVKKAVLAMIEHTLDKDLKNLSEDLEISLLAKWLPSENATSRETKRLARLIIKEVYKGNSRKYRKHLSLLRKHMRLIENNLRERDYSFDYKAVPGKALLKYTRAFERNDSERYSEFIEEIKNDKTIMNKKMDQLFPYEIIRKLDQDEELANSLWASLSNEPSQKKVIVVRDGSGSMWGGYGFVTPHEVADSLAIYTAERLSGEFYNKFITFSRKPRLLDFDQSSKLSDKVRYLDYFNEASNTDILKVYSLILESYKKAKPEDYLDYVLIISDMQFDVGASYDESTFETLERMFEMASLPMPKMVYWNVNGDGSGFPTTEDKGIFISGFSPNTLKLLLKGDISNAHEIMIEALSIYDERLKELGI